MVTVWNIDSKKCYRTFKHRGKVLAVALSKAQCITGCEQGRVKVWNLETGKLIKVTSYSYTLSVIMNFIKATMSLAQNKFIRSCSLLKQLYNFCNSEHWILPLSLSFTAIDDQL